jgi:RNA polymerase sigma factor (sigma-70 family)
MGGGTRRSRGVTSTVTAPRPPRAALDFEALYRAARDDVYAYATALLRDRAAAEDVTALAFERAYRKRAGYRAERGSARAWLFGIARNAALDELRRRKRTAALTAEPADPDAAAPEDAAEAALRRAAVRTALAALPPRDREIVALKFHAGLDNAELAAVLGVSPSNAGTLLHRAMTKLREAVEHA